MRKKKGDYIRLDSTSSTVEDEAEIYWHLPIDKKTYFWVGNGEGPGSGTFEDLRSMKKLHKALGKAIQAKSRSRYQHVIKGKGRKSAIKGVKTIKIKET